MGPKRLSYSSSIESIERPERTEILSGVSLPSVALERFMKSRLVIFKSFSIMSNLFSLQAMEKALSISY